MQFLFQASITVKCLRGFRVRLVTVMSDAQYAQRLAKARQTADASVHCKRPDYIVGNEVWLSQKLGKESYSKAQASLKLCIRPFGPFCILELVGKNAI